MFADDFNFNKDTGLFEETAATSYLGEVVLRLRAKRRSIKKNENGNSIYPGDWFFDPDFGCNSYEVETVSEENVRKVQRMSEAALKIMIVQKKIISCNVQAVVDVTDRRRINVHASATNNDGTNLSYQLFKEVL